MRFTWLLALALTGASPEPPPPGPADAPRVETTPAGRRVALTGGATLFVPYGFRPGAGGAVDLLLYLHGAPSAVEPAAAESGWTGVLVEFNRKGLSSVYTKPFSDPALFPRLIDAALDGVKRLGLVDAPKAGRVVVSAFSAGFGGVRELLKVPGHFARIDGLVLADSLYCGYAGDPARKEVDPALMDGFRRFAAEAAAGRKTLVLTHSAQVPGGYASTTETADFLIRAVGEGAKAGPAKADWGGGWTQTRAFARGKFLVLGFAGDGPEDHMVHLRRVGRVWARFRSLAGDPS